MKNQKYWPDIFDASIPCFIMPVIDSACLSCGACCASFRVSFYWAEADDGGGTVPAHLTEQRDAFHRCMKGTWSVQPYCVALQGEVGKAVGCAIYDLRSSSCRDLAEGSEQCHRARARWGLPVPDRVAMGE